VGHIQGSDRLKAMAALSGEYLMWLVKIQNQPFKVNFLKKNLPTRSRNSQLPFFLIIFSYFILN
jgi:hypothetical protein